jgi:hypothetical protein
MTVIVDAQADCRALPSAGLLAGHYYDPYPPRFAANLKGLINAGFPVITRIHPGVRYPMTDADLFGRVDLEGHVTAIVGYDDSRNTITFADPWPTDQFGGAYGGPRDEDEEEGIGTIVVNATLDYCCTGMPLPVAIEAVQVGESVIEIRAQISLRMPNAVVPAITSIEDILASIQLPDGLRLQDSTRRQVALLTLGEVTTVVWRATVDDAVNGEIRVAVAGIACGNDPYRYRDVVGGQADLRIWATAPERSAALVR